MAPKRVDAIVREVTEHLASRGLTMAGVPLDVVPLAGGVSNDVYAVTGPGVDVVVKRALGTLRVTEEWSADPARIVREGQALQWAETFSPESVPHVIDLDPHFLVIERAPHDWVEWRSDLMRGVADATVARRLGEVLGLWQERTRVKRSPADVLTDRTVFHQLRVDPFHRTVLRQHPDVAEEVQRTIDEMLSRQTCLVHGDFTPKNVLVGPPRSGCGYPPVWVLDWEVAHIGDQYFDPASLLAHLLLKTVHRASPADELLACARDFLTSWREHLDPREPDDHLHLARQVGCMLLARVDGKSPALYLKDRERTEVRALGRSLVVDPPTNVLDAWRVSP